MQSPQGRIGDADSGSPTLLDEMLNQVQHDRYFFSNLQKNDIFFQILHFDLFYLTFCNNENKIRVVKTVFLTKYIFTI